MKIEKKLLILSSIIILVSAVLNPIMIINHDIKINEKLQAISKLEFERTRIYNIIKNSDRLENNILRKLEYVDLIRLLEEQITHSLVKEVILVRSKEIMNTCRVALFTLELGWNNELNKYLSSINKIRMNQNEINNRYKNIKNYRDYEDLYEDYLFRTQNAHNELISEIDKYKTEKINLENHKLFFLIFFTVLLGIGLSIGILSNYLGSKNNENT